MKNTLYIILALLSLAAHAQQEDAWQKWGPTEGLKGGGFIARAQHVGRARIAGTKAARVMQAE